MAIMTSRTEGFQRWSANEFNYMRSHNIRETDKYAKFTINSELLEPSSPQQYVGLCLLPNGLLITTGVCKINHNIANGDVLLSFPDEICTQFACAYRAPLLTKSTSKFDAEVPVYFTPLKNGDVVALGSVASARSSYIDFSGVILVPGDK